MEYDFLDQFWKRMKHVGMYAVLMKNSMQKTTWKQYHIDKIDEQVNLIFAVLMFIMEKSLKEEVCTIDEIGIYLDDIDSRYLKKGFTYDQSKKLGEFIVNVVLCDEGHAMYFDCFHFGQKAYQIQNISYVGNKVVYLESDLRRTSYYLTDDGYNLLLSTLEIESNMKITVHEIIFKMHLERAAYDKAVDDIKNIFNLLRIQFLKMEEAMVRIRRNALEYSIKDYKTILEENMAIMDDTKKKFNYYREVVKQRVEELEETDIHVKKLEKKETDNLKYLKVIESYLRRTLKEHQKIFGKHMDLKELYSKELEELSQMVFIKRFSLRNQVYNEILKQPDHLTNLEYFLRPLWNCEIHKIYNINKAFEKQQVIRKKQENEESEILILEDDFWQEELRKQYEEKRAKYSRCIAVILKYTYNEKRITLSSLNELPETEKEMLIPSVEIFKEVLVELLKNKEIDLEKLRKERMDFITQTGLEVSVNELILEEIERHKEWSHIRYLTTVRLSDKPSVVFHNVNSNLGRVRMIKCSNLLFSLSAEQIEVEERN